MSILNQLPIMGNSGSGGSSGTGTLNLFTQNEEPEIKDGIWIKTEKQFKDIVIDSSFLTGRGWIDPNISIKTLYPYSTAGKPIPIGDYIYIVGLGGSTSTNIYPMKKWNPKTLELFELATAPFDFNYSCNAVSYGTDIFIFNSYDRTISGKTVTYKKACRYDTLKDTYETLPDIPFYYRGGGISIYKDEIYLFGSLYDDTSSFVNGKNRRYTYKYNITNKTYTKLADMPDRFNDASVFTINDNIYIIGNCPLSVFTKNIYKYSIKNNNFEIINNVFPVPFGGGKAINVNSDIYCFGNAFNFGSSYTPKYQRESLYKYNINTGSVTQLEDIITNNIDPVEVSQATFFDNKIYLFNSLKILIYELGSSEYKEYDFVILRNSDYYGKYYTQFMSLPIENKICTRAATGFDNAWIYADGELKEYPTYYGDGTKWIKFKN